MTAPDGPFAGRNRIAPHDLAGHRLVAAAAVHGPQKGATPANIQTLDTGLTHLVHYLTQAGYPDAERYATTTGPAPPAESASPVSSSAAAPSPAPTTSSTSLTSKPTYRVAILSSPAKAGSTTKP